MPDAGGGIIMSKFPCETLADSSNMLEDIEARLLFLGEITLALGVMDFSDEVWLPVA